MKLKVQVSGLGAICANGLNPHNILESCLKGQSTIGPHGLSEITAENLNFLHSQTPLELKQSKCTVLGYYTLNQALKDSGWSSDKLKSAGFIFATTTGKIDLWEKTFSRYDSPSLDPEEFKKGLKNQPLGAPLLELAQYFEIKGPVALISSSCSASLQAIAMGMMWIQSGKVDRCIIGSTEISSDLTRVGFGSLRLLSSATATPFDKNRTGINLGEAGAFLFLEKQTSDDSRAKWGLISGASLSSDAFHPTSPHPEGRGSYLAMKKALDYAQLQANDLEWIYAHGTGSPANDLAESRAINALFPHQPYVTSTKSLHGHTLGACGALESVIGLLAMKKSVIIPNVHLREVDPQILVKLPTQLIEKPIGHFLKNSLGFGGINVSVIFSKESAH